MNKKDTYTYKQILLGLRKEFLEAQKRLDELNKYVFIFDENKVNYYFNLYKSPYEEKAPELTLDINEQSQNKLLNMMKNAYGYKRPSRAIMLRNNNGDYYPFRPYWVRKNDFNISIDPLLKVEFKELVEELLNSDFAKYMTLPTTITAIEAQSIPRIVPRSFQLDLLTDKSQILYLGRKDILELAIRKKRNERWEPLTQELLDYILEIEFPKDAFPEYHQRIIEESIYDDMEFILCKQIKPKTHERLQVREEGKKLILEKINNR